MRILNHYFFLFKISLYFFSYFFFGIQSLLQLGITWIMDGEKQYWVGFSKYQTWFGQFLQTLSIGDLFHHCRNWGHPPNHLCNTIWLLLDFFTPLFIQRRCFLWLPQSHIGGILLLWVMSSEVPGVDVIKSWDSFICFLLVDVTSWWIFDCLISGCIEFAPFFE